MSETDKLKDVVKTYGKAMASANNKLIEAAEKVRQSRQEREGQLNHRQ